MCPTTEFLPAYSDGSLDLGDDIVIEEHLVGGCDAEGCAECCGALLRINPPLGKAAFAKRMERNPNQISARSSAEPTGTTARRKFVTNYQFAASTQPLRVHNSIMIRPSPIVSWPTGPIMVSHGGDSKEWLALERYLEKDLHLKCVEFNSEAAAGYTTQERLEAMLDVASFAFVVMTAADKHEDDNYYARPNVIHEAGLFQGKLGRLNAVLLVECGCATPSNVSGLAHISFPRGNIQAAFYQVGRVLKARGLERGDGF